MLILSVRTDKPEAELGLYEDSEVLSTIIWHAHRELSDTIHNKIRDLLESNDKKWTDIRAVAFYKGPGSFTGLRIGASVANALAGSLNIPIVAFNGDDWQRISIEALLAGSNDQTAIPEYGAEPHTTKQVK